MLFFSITSEDIADDFEEIYPFDKPSKVSNLFLPNPREETNIFNLSFVVIVKIFSRFVI